MQNPFLLIIAVVTCLNIGNAEEPLCISKVTTSPTNATITGAGAPKLEVVLRLGKTERTKKLEWASSVAGPFDARITSTNKIPIGDDRFGNGIIFSVQTAGVVSTSNIAMFDRNPVPVGTVRFRPMKSKTIPAVKWAGNTVAVADILCADGTSIPLSIFVRERQIANP